MSFNHFSKFVKDHGQGQHLNTTFDWNEAQLEKKPWIVIDYNNFVFAILDNIKGGHVALIEQRLELIWKSLVECGAKICIINDGKTHSEERAIKKLQRMHSDMVESIEPKTSFLTSELVPTLIYSVAERVLREHYPGVAIDNVEDNAKETTYMFCTANGEADPVIRAFCQRKIRQGDDVYVLSADNCMLPGIFPTASAHLYSVDLKSLSVVNVADTGRQVLKGTAYDVLSMLHHLGVKTDEVLGLGQRGGAVTGEMFAYICALLYGETAAFRPNEYDQSTPLVTYVRAYLCGERKYSDNYFVMLLYVTTALVRAWFKSSTRRGDDFAQCVQAVREHALAVYNRAPASNLLGLPCFFDSSGAMLKYARRLLYVSEEVKDSQRIFIDNRSVGKSVLSNKRLTVSVDYGGKGTLYAATPTGGGYVTYSSTNDMRDGCPLKLASVPVAEAVSKEIMHRRNALACLEAPLDNCRRTLWGNWSDNEDVEQSTEQLLSPLLSLVKQVEFMRSRVSREPKQPSVNSIVDAASFNAYLSTVVECSRQRPRDQTGKGKGGEEEEELDNGGEDDTARSISLITSIVRLDTASHHQHNIYTCQDMYNKYVRRGRSLPCEGVIVAAPSDPIGLMFKAPEKEPMKCSRDDSRYVNSPYGTLFCLRNRAHYLQQLLCLPAPGWGQAAEALTPRELAASSIFRSLDIKKTVSDAACSAISECWLSLPCATQDQLTHLVTQVTLHRISLLCTALLCAYNREFEHVHAP